MEYKKVHNRYNLMKFAGFSDYKDGLVFRVLAQEPQNKFFDKLEIESAVTTFGNLGCRDISNYIYSSYNNVDVKFTNSTFQLSNEEKTLQAAYEELIAGKEADDAVKIISSIEVGWYEKALDEIKITSKVYGKPDELTGLESLCNILLEALK